MCLRAPGMAPLALPLPKDTCPCWSIMGARALDRRFFMSPRRGVRSGGMGQAWISRRRKYVSPELVEDTEIMVGASGSASLVCISDHAPGPMFTEPLLLGASGETAPAAYGTLAWSDFEKGQRGPLNMQGW